MSAPADGRTRRLIYAAATLRSLAVGAMGVLLGLYLAALGLPPERIGAVISAGLAGAAAAGLIATVWGDRIGRRRVLAGVALASAAAAAAAALTADFAALCAAAFFGTLNGMGRDRGASLVLEQAILPQTVPAARRTAVFAWYNLLQDGGAAAGSLLAGLPALLVAAGLDRVAGFRAVLAIYAGLMTAAAALAWRLPDATEAPAPRRAPLRPRTRRTLWRISALFAMDSLGGGFLTTSLLAFFFAERFGAGPGAVGLLFFAARVANAGSHLAAAWLARRIGLVPTMVFTHVPSSLLLLTVPYAPSFAVAAALFLLREGLVEMDVPTRQSYVMAVVEPDERTFASGVTHLVRVGAWAIGPAFAGLLTAGLGPAAPLWIGAGIKVVYDGLLYSAFRHLRPPEEQAREP